MTTYTEMKKWWSALHSKIRTTILAETRIRRTYSPNYAPTEDEFTTILNTKNLNIINSEALEGIEMLQSLENLQLHCPFKHNYNPVGLLSGLKKLKIDFAESRVGFLSSLPQLESLSLSYCDLKSFEHFSSLTNLTELHIDGNDIEETTLNHLANLTALKKLEVRASKINNIEALANLNNLTELSITRGNFSNISVLSNLTKLKKLQLVDCKIESLEGLENLKSLTYMNVMVNKISSLEPLKELKNLIDLDFSINGKITDLFPLQNLTKLKKLVCCGKFDDLTFLSNLQNLTELVIDSNTQLKNFSMLPVLEKVSKARFRFCSIDNANGLNNLRRLKNLDIICCKLSSLAPLKELPHLNILRIQDTPVTDWDELQFFPVLQKLIVTYDQFSKNQKKDIKNLCPHLKIKI